MFVWSTLYLSLPFPNIHNIIRHILQFAIILRPLFQFFPPLALSLFHSAVNLLEITLVYSAHFLASHRLPKTLYQHNFCNTAGSFLQMLMASNKTNLDSIRLHVIHFSAASDTIKGSCVFKLQFLWCDPLEQCQRQRENNWINTIAMRMQEKINKRHHCIPVVQRELCNHTNTINYPQNSLCLLFLSLSCMNHPLLSSFLLPLSPYLLSLFHFSFDLFLNVHTWVSLCMWVQCPQRSAEGIRSPELEI